MIDPRIYLASRSPRRRELLTQIGVRFDLLLFRSGPREDEEVSEAWLPDETPEAYVQRVARAKAVFGSRLLASRPLVARPVLAADTTVTLDGKIFGKPDNAEHAATMLRELSGREHQVLSAVAVSLGEHVEVAVSVSTVRFAALDDERIRRYLLTREYSDKAGGYAIQGHAGAFIENISGSYSGVMGLPLFETVELLRHFDYPTP